MNDITPPLVTIGIPTFNRGALIEQTLQAAVTQDYPALEIIIADNASTDATETICSRFAQQYSQINYIRHPKNLGATENFNHVLAQAKGAYFMWLGDDDWIDSNYISACVEKLQAEPSAVLVAGTPKYYYGNEYLYTGLLMMLDQALPSQRLRAYFAAVQHNGIFYGLMPTALIQQQPLKHIMGGDLLTICSLVFLGKAYTVSNTCLHRRRGGSSIDGKALAKSMALPWLDQYFPRLSLAANIWQHILADASFSRLSKWQRYLLATQAISLAFYHKIMTICFKQRFIERAGLPDSLKRHKRPS